MSLRISGKNLDVGEALRGQAETRVAAALSKYYEGGYQGHVTVAKDGTAFKTDGVLHLSSGITLEASGTAHDAYASLDKMAERIEKAAASLQASAEGPLGFDQWTRGRHRNPQLCDRGSRTTRSRRSSSIWPEITRLSWRNRPNPFMS
jgi:ribosomal subunit interface protein